jgi:hypothetical protein
MANWTVISKDLDSVDKTTIGVTLVMKVPSGMIVRNIMTTGAISMVFVPDPQPTKTDPFQVENLLEKWIGENKIV